MLQRVRRAAVGLLVLLAVPAAAHWVSPESIVAGVNADETRRRWGVETAERDAKTPRLLVIRVGPGWYARSVPDRTAQAAAWYDFWHHNVPRGIVSILDAKSETPVVQFGRGGSVTEVTAVPPGAR